MEDLLKRAELKYFGAYLLSGCEPGPYIQSHDETQKEMLDAAYEELREKVEGVEEKLGRKILDSANALSAAYERAGFYAGIKVGARVMVSLLERGEIVF